MFLYSQAIASTDVRGSEAIKAPVYEFFLATSDTPTAMTPVVNAFKKKKKMFKITSFLLIDCIFLTDLSRI